jgi:hypothetical protein
MKKRKTQKRIIGTKYETKEGREKTENSNNFTSQMVFSALLLQVYLCIIVGI